MLYVWIGSISFLFFALSDLNEVRFQRKILLYAFPIGCVTLAAATLLLFAFKPADLTVSASFHLLAGILAVFNFILLIVSLIVVWRRPELQKSIASNKKIPFDRGLYAMCRHPGVLFFIFFYAFLALALERSTLLMAGGWFSVLNLVYSLWQDHFILPKLLINYDGYHSRTPFLIPTADSMRRGIKTLRKAAAIVE